MDPDYAANQGNLLNGVVDIQMRRGICFALSMEWCLSLIHI